MHAHVATFCRHCGSIENMHVERSLEDARKYLRDLPEFFASEPAFGAVKIDNYTEDLLRVYIDPHDLVTMTVICENNFEECLDNWQREAALKMLARRMAEALKTGLGMDVESEEKPRPPFTAESKEEAYKHLLSQIDLPEDFFGPTTAS